MSKVINTNPLDKNIEVKGISKIVHCLNELYLDRDNLDTDPLAPCEEDRVLKGWIEALEWVLKKQERS